MIPKIIHYCWFGKNQIPNELLQYIETWSKHCPDYQIMLWNENNFDIESCEFTKKHYQNRKYAFVSDYARAFALYHHGGIYLDTDVELKKNLDCFLKHEAFSGFESRGLPFTAVWGSSKKHKLAELVISYYNKIGHTEMQQSNTDIISKYLIEKYNINPKKNAYQTGSYLDSKIAIYPSEYFCLDLPPNYATHHFFGSWLPNKTTSTKKSINLNYFIEKVESEANSDEFIKAVARSVKLKTFIKIAIRMIYYRFTPKKIDSWIKNKKNKC
jgi:hypothetical protein